MRSHHTVLHRTILHGSPILISLCSGELNQVMYKHGDVCLSVCILHVYCICVFSVCILYVYCMCVMYVCLQVKYRMLGIRGKGYDLEQTIELLLRAALANSALHASNSYSGAAPSHHTKSHTNTTKIPTQPSVSSDTHHTSETSSQMTGLRQRLANGLKRLVNRKGLSGTEVMAGRSGWSTAATAEDAEQVAKRLMAALDATVTIHLLAKEAVIHMECEVEKVTEIMRHTHIYTHTYTHAHTR